VNAGKHTVQEIYSQPRVWADALAVFEAGEAAFSDLIAAAEPDHVVVTGCGSTYYLSLTAAPLLRGAGIDAQARPASELLLFPESIYLKGRKYALITVSRSGATTETRLAGSAFKARIGGPVITVTCDSGSPLARKSDLAFAIDSAGERASRRPGPLAVCAFCGNRWLPRSPGMSGLRASDCRPNVSSCWIPSGIWRKRSGPTGASNASSFSAPICSMASPAKPC